MSGIWLVQLWVDAGLSKFQVPMRGSQCHCDSDWDFFPPVFLNLQSTGVDIDE